MELLRIEFKESVNLNGKRLALHFSTFLLEVSIFFYYEGRQQMAAVWAEPGTPVTNRDHTQFTDIIQSLF